MFFFVLVSCLSVPRFIFPRQPLLMSLLAAELAQESQQPPVRQLAGVLLKNCVNFVAPAQASASVKAWSQVGATERNQVKQAALGSLASPCSPARHTGAQVVAAIGAQELPLNEWPELIQGLVNNVTSSGNACLKESSLEALGFICEEVEPRVLETQSNLILTAVIQGMRQEEPNFEVRRQCVSLSPSASACAAQLLPCLCQRCRRHTSILAHRPSSALSRRLPRCPDRCASPARKPF